MGSVIEFPNRLSVRFFSDSVYCGWCEQPTQGRVFDESSQIICSVCHGVMLDMSEDTEMVIEFDPENDDDG